MGRKSKKPISEIKPYRVYTIQDACDLLGVSRETFYKFINLGLIKGWKFGRTWRITGEDLLRQIRAKLPSEEEQYFLSRLSRNEG